MRGPEVVPVSRVVVGLLLAAAVATGMTWLRFDAVNIALATAGVLVVAAALLAQDSGREVTWPRIVEPDRGGYRHEVSQLSWALTGKDGRINELGLRRLRAVAADRLALLGVDLEADPEGAREVLGPGPYATLHPPPGQLPPARAVSACLAALERLDPAPDRRSSS